MDEHQVNNKEKTYEWSCLLREKENERRRLQSELRQLADEANNYLNNDGSRGFYWAVGLSDARKELESILQKHSKEGNSPGEINAEP